MKKSLFPAFALLALTSTANAAIIPIYLTGVFSGGPPGPQPGVVSQTSSASWTYDTVTGDIAGTGSYTVAFNFGPNNVFTQQWQDLSITGAGIASGTPFANAPTGFRCTNGPFAAAGLNRDVCAGYQFNSNGNESSVSPDGLTVTLGGDDTIAGLPQSLQGNFGVTGRTLAGTTLTAQAPGYTGFQSGTFQLVYSTVVPVPAAVWLFGSALGLMGFARRRMTEA